MLCDQESMCNEFKLLLRPNIESHLGLLGKTILKQEMKNVGHLPPVPILNTILLLAMTKTDFFIVVLLSFLFAFFFLDHKCV